METDNHCLVILNHVMHTHKSIVYTFHRIHSHIKKTIKIKSSLMKTSRESKEYITFSNISLQLNVLNIVFTCNIRVP